MSRVRRSGARTGMVTVMSLPLFSSGLDDPGNAAVLVPDIPFVLAADDSGVAAARAGIEQHIQPHMAGARRPPAPVSFNVLRGQCREAVSLFLLGRFDVRIAVGSVLTCFRFFAQRNMPFIVSRKLRAAAGVFDRPSRAARICCAWTAAYGLGLNAVGFYFLAGA